jgi:hypothetical protein
MDQKLSFYQEAKRLLNDQNSKPYSDQEINQILELLNVFTDSICHNITQKP